MPASATHQHLPLYEKGPSFAEHNAAISHMHFAHGLTAPCLALSTLGQVPGTIANFITKDSGHEQHQGLGPDKGSPRDDPATNDSGFLTETKSSGTTPPPTQQDLEQNNITRSIPAPSLQEFLIQHQSSLSAASLDPEESVLPTEIQEITPEEFTCSIDAAARSAAHILALKLPRHCKRKAEELADSLMSSRRTWEETGALPDADNIKITNPTDPSPSTSRPVKKSRKRVTRSQTKKPSTARAVDLLIKNPDNPAPYPQQAQGSVPTTDTGLSTGPSNDNPSASTADLQSPTLNTQAAESMDINPWDPIPDESLQGIGPLQSSTNPPPPNVCTADSNRSPDTSAPNNPAHSLHQTVPDDPPGSGAARPKSPNLFTPAKSHTANSEPAQSSASPHPVKLTIIKSDPIRAQVFSIHQQFTGSKPSWSKYQTTWQSLKFHFQRTGGSYGGWVQTITKLADGFLAPCASEQWYCPDLIDFPKLSSFGDKTNDLRPGSFIPTLTKIPHPESTIVRGLFRLLNPPRRLHTDWARLVAASVEFMADTIFRPPKISSSQENDHVAQGVATLAYLDAVKNSSPAFDPPNPTGDPSDISAQRLHSVDVIHEFRNVVIDVMMAYIILQTHYLSDAPLTPAQKKANTQSNQPSVNDTMTPVQKAPSDLANPTAHAAHHLQNYQRKQNFQPLVYFVLAGVRGLFVTSRDHRVAGISTCMLFIQAMSVIRQHLTTPHTPEESIWKHLSACLVQIF
ncbi:hypothetical protein PtB15_15B397 [Puccinia triticina]|nr:hypothetical protein PtB15_15B397 [Puccinia triticina]